MTRYIVFIKSFISESCQILALQFIFLHALLPSQRALARDNPMPIEHIRDKAQVGDIVFIRIPSYPFRKIAEDTNSWTNHVGIITHQENGEWMVSESTFPFSRATKLSRFLARSEQGQFAVMRLKQPLTAEQQQNLLKQAQARYGVLYDTGFDLYSKRQFCSRFVHEVVADTTHISLGDVESLDKLFKTNPKADLQFWNLWYIGSIPWERKTVTPASILEDNRLKIIIEGKVQPIYWGKAV